MTVLEVVGKGTDINKRPYLIIQPSEMPVKDGKSLIVQFVLYWNEKKEKFYYYATTEVRRQP